MQHNLIHRLPTWLRARRRNLPVLLTLTLVTFFTFYSFLEQDRSLRLPGHVTGSQQHGQTGPWHPINDLISQGEQRWAALLAEETHDLGDAAKKYRERRRRHPPPGFDKWFKFAQENDAVIVEEFFDQIYHDIAPFWAFSPRWISQQAKNFDHVISVSHGKAKYKTDNVKRVPWVPLWYDMIKGIAKYLPDVDIPINVMDEPRILVPHDKMKNYADAERRSRRMQPADMVSQEFSGIPSTSSKDRFDAMWNLNGAVWDLYKKTCPTDTEGHNLPAVTDYSQLPDIKDIIPKHSYHGYVANWTVAKSPCHYPQIRELHGSFIEPTSMAITQELIPLFGGSKLQHNSEIIIPGTAYWSKNADYDPEAGSWTDWFDIFGMRRERPWSRKRNQILWRGPAQGGRNRKENWTHFHRHRFAQMMNGSAVQGAGVAAEQRLQTTNIAVSSVNPYNLSSLAVPATAKTGRLGALGEWLSYYTDVAFTNLVCFPHEIATDSWKLTCPYSSPFYKVRSKLSMRSTLSSKYLPDLDGNSYSGRWLALLRSSALPMKATIYSEWHDHRLVPWVHFVPLDNTYADLYGVMEYFLGFDDKPGRDEVAERLAIQGKVWAARVLRKVDMRIYTWRLLLEYARVCDQERDRIGWVKDILK